jgi:putative transposase
VKFGFMAKHRGAWPVAMMCEALGVSRSGFYAWLSRPPSQRCREVEEMAPHVRQSFIASDRTYGARRVWFDMLELGYECGLHRIERLMQATRITLARGADTPASSSRTCSRNMASPAA